MKQQTPVAQQSSRAVALRQALPIRLRQQYQSRRQLAARFESQLILGGNLKQAASRHDVALAMRHLQTRTRQLAVPFDNAAENARRDQQSSRLSLRQEPL